MKRIGIIFAMEEELQSLLDLVELKKEKKILKRKKGNSERAFWKG